jgi:exonuclease SbcC
MIPQKITLKNFLSYRQAELDFSGLHTACICGENGAGKSSLLEAISWAVWGETRATSDDDLIYLGETSLRVDYQFMYNQQFYRIIRSRQKAKGGTLDFQILNNNSYKSLSGKGIKDTQNKILECLNIDYDTFINSAYLRQGRSDEFMQNKPSDRKKILANLLKLDQYDKLATEAKDLVKQFKIRSEEISRNLEEQQVKLEEKEAIVLDLNNTNKELKYYQDIVQKTNSQLQEIQSLNSNRKSWEEKFTWQKNNLQTIYDNLHQLTKDKQDLAQEIDKLQEILNQEDDINNNYAKLEQLRKEDNELNLKFNAYQKLLTQKQKLEQKLNETTNQLTLQIEREKTNLDNLIKEQKELTKIVGNSHNLTDDLATLQAYREQLAQLDQLQLQITPLLQQKQIFITNLKGEESKLEAKLEQLIKEETQIEEKLAQVPSLRKKFFDTEEKLNKIDITRNYQERIKEKGTQQKELRQEYLTKKNYLIENKEKLAIKLATLNQEQAICPLCEQHLDENHRHYVIQKTEAEREQIQADCWYLEEQIIEIDRKLKDLKEEYLQLTQELAIADSLKQTYIKLENQLDLSGDLYEKQEDIQLEKEQTEDLLINQKFGQELRSELKILEDKIKLLNYSEADHALIRKKESDLRRVEYQQLKIQDSQKKLDKLSLIKPELETKIIELESELIELTKNSDLQLQINEVNAEMSQLNYDSQQHNHMRQTLQELQSYQILYSELQQAKKQHPLLGEKLEQINLKLQTAQAEAEKYQQELNQINEQLSQLTDYSQELNKLEQEST